MNQDEITKDSDEEEVVVEPTAEEAVAEGIEDVLGGDVDPDEQTPDEISEEVAEPEESVDDAAAEAPEGEPEAAEGVSAEADEGTIDYTVPEGLNERSTDRFNKLVEDNKAQRELVEAHTETLNGMRDMVQKSGLSNEEYIGAIDFAATVKRDPAEGIKMMQGYIKHIAKVTGIEPEGMEVDMLDDFPDLKESVEDMAMTKEAAIELAQARRAKQANEAATETATQERENALQYSQAQDEAVGQLATYLTELQKNDIDWEAKAPLVLDAAKFAKTELHPTKWVGHIKNEVARINKIAGAVKGKARTETPLTGGNAPRGGQKEPQSIAEALDQLL